MKFNNKKYEEFLEIIEDNIYFDISGMDIKGSLSIPKSWLLQIQNWAGICTDPNETEDYYKNPRAMYVALDLIYRLVDSVEV